MPGKNASMEPAANIAPHDGERIRVSDCPVVDIRMPGMTSVEAHDPMKCAGSDMPVINRLEIEFASFVKSPPAPLCQRGVIPPFGKGRLGGIFRQCLDNYVTLDIVITAHGEDHEIGACHNHRCVSVSGWLFKQQSHDTGRAGSLPEIKRKV